MYLVLRPNCLSIYKDKEETKLRHQINLSEITAVARQRDSKKKMDHVFGIFSPARNYHLGAKTDKDAQEWVHLIRQEARIDEDDADITMLASPVANNISTRDFSSQPTTDNIISSSSDVERRPPSSSLSLDNMHSARRPSQALQYSGNERGSMSDIDFSDTGFQASATSLGRRNTQRANNPNANPNPSQQSNIGTTPDEDRVVYHGSLYVLKSKGGVRQWKKMWVVLRPKCLALYKNDNEYSATLIIPFASIIDAVDIDSISRSKEFCMQVITEEKNLKFCAKTEDSLAKWLGAFKSLLMKKKEAERATQSTGAAMTNANSNTNTAPQAQTQTQTQVQPQQSHVQRSTSQRTTSTAK